MSKLQELKDIFSGTSSFLVAAHESPDGDAIGSTVALGHLLKRLHKEVILYNASKLPAAFDWLDFSVPVVNKLPETMPEYVIALDCGNRERLGPQLAARLKETRSINIDHHLNNPGFADVNWVDTSASSVGEMIAELALYCGLELSGGLGQGVNLALVSDTGEFTFSNTKPQTLELSAKILRAGLNLEQFTARRKNQWTFNRLKLWALAFSSVELYCNARVGLISITNQMLKETGTIKDDYDELINIIRRIRGLEIAVCMRERDKKSTKVSLRSCAGVDVAAIAAMLGGGGHKMAAGCLIRLPVEQAKDKLLSTIKNTM